MKRRASMVLTNIVPVVFAFLLDAGVIVIYIFAPGLWEGDKHKSWQDRLDFTHQMLVMACLAALRMLFFIPYVCKLYSPYHRIRWCIPLTWLLLHQIAVCVRAGFLSRNDFDLGVSSVGWSSIPPHFTA